MATSLTAGAVRNLRKLEERKTNPTDFTPILQVIKIDEDELKTGKHYTLTLSDGQHYLQAALDILKPSARKLFEQLRENSIIRAKRFVKIGGKGLEVSIILLKFDVITTSNSPRIGNPIDICDVFFGDDDPEVLFMLADEYEREGNKYKHLVTLKLAAEAGHATAAGKIGSMYLSCKDKEQRGKAKKYLRLAAEEGDGSIRGRYGFYLANLHRDEGDIKNYISVLDAVAASHAEASYVLGAYYLTGKYVEIDREKARFYLNRAANMGHYVAEEVMDLRGLKKTIS